MENAVKQVLCFQNPGEIDPRLVTTLGVNVKDSDSAIGFFGTGLKYGLAVATRLDCIVQIQSGETVYTFSKSRQTIRGKDFDLIGMTTNGTSFRELGFTTELGKRWEPWMAYREFYCNALDEGGTVQMLDGLPEPEAGITKVLVLGDPLVAVHSKRDLYFIPPGTAPLVEVDGLQIFAGPAGALYYKGVRVCELQKGQQSLYRYNVLGDLDLTEDRTIASYYFYSPLVSAVAKKLENSAMLRNIMCAKATMFEGQIDWNHLWGAPSEQFVATLKLVLKNHRNEMSPKLIKLAVEHCGSIVYPPAVLTAVEQKMLDKALKFLAEIGHEVTERIEIVESLGDPNTFGLAEDETIWVPKALFGKGTKFVAGTVLEEHLHLRHGFGDCTREMQNWLFDRLVSLGEELRGEPL